jgi:hypothetical protein
LFVVSVSQLLSLSTTRLGYALTKPCKPGIRIPIAKPFPFFFLFAPHVETGNGLVAAVAKLAQPCLGNYQTEQKIRRLFSVPRLGFL